ncbi:hypothetical protein NC653_005124 [Populus alba x Populus x berolinensis]|uniref:Uncharacterized protein n=1 Tax=Populus alba x Populus x berolinensis TaxID=444605 RepID=A0AAD6WAP2_9ROSI|nr:hypothetical protein NC653_005124 [Populus alba x Populus x berolinensis]
MVFNTVLAERKEEILLQSHKQMTGGENWRRKVADYYGNPAGFTTAIAVGRRLLTPSQHRRLSFPRTFMTSTLSYGYRATP